MRTPRARLIRSALLAFVFAAAPRVALACPVCFGENDSPLALGINYGILVMLVLIVGLWVAFGSFFIYLRRRARLAGTGEWSPAGAASVAGGDGREAAKATLHARHAQEGTV